MYILKNDFNWFGEIIPAGTIYKQSQRCKDRYICHTPNGNQCDHKNLTFMTVKNNQEYFIKVDETWLMSILSRY